MPGYLELRQEAFSLLSLGEHLAALRLFRRLLDAWPADFQVRLQVGDSLALLGQRARARQVFAALTALHLQAGRTLPALHAAKALDELDPGATTVYQKLATMYGAGSDRTRLGARPTEIEPLPDLAVAAGSSLVTPDEVLQTATAAAASLQGRAERAGPLPPLPIFSDLEADDILLLLRTLRRVRFAAGETILREGEPGDSFFLLGHGTVRVSRETATGPLLLARLSQGAVLGDLTLLQSAPRSATAVAEEPVDGLEVPLATLDALARRRPGVAQAVTRYTQQRLIQNAVLRSPLLRPLYPERLEPLTRLFQLRTLEASATLLREGEDGPGLSVLLAGEGEVLRWDGARQASLARLGPPEVVGEMSLLGDRPASATVVARTPVSLLFLPREAFALLVQQEPELEAGLQQLAETRQVENLLQLGDATGNALADEEEVLL